MWPSPDSRCCRVTCSAGSTATASTDRAGRRSVLGEGEGDRRSEREGRGVRGEVRRRLRYLWPEVGELIKVSVVGTAVFVARREVPCDFAIDADLNCAVADIVIF